MKIYTRGGDSGKTSLVGGARVDKHDARLDCYGTVDELNSYLGICATSLLPHQSAGPLQELQLQILAIQNYLFNIGSHLACESDTTRAFLPTLEEQETLNLEIQIDQMTLQLPPLKDFILPGGSSLAAHLHFARTVCRRAERHTSAFAQQNSIHENLLVLRYLNRLSDYLFVAARFANHCLNSKELLWKKK